jgi:cytochrome c oxidase assembly protein subunit 11
MDRQAKIDPGTQRSNKVVAGVCLAFIGGMVGMSYAAVPLYAMFCQMTGYGGTTQRVEQYSDRVLDREITVRFDANTSSVPWDFKPAARDVTMKIGETTQIHYTAKNLSTRPTSGRATFNVTPEMAGAYFNKVECFCFTVLCRSRHRRRAGTQGREDDYAFLHILPHRGGKAGGRRAAG